MPQRLSVTQLREDAMKLEFLYAPTRDLQAALALYRDELGWEEAWREGESTVSLKLPGTDVQLMLDAAEPDGGSAFGPIFVLDDVKRFFAERPAALSATAEPDEIPGGFLATFQDPSGNTIYVMDQSTEAG
jgi:predicted enzyme related to lactoylglutathione lyase